MTYSELAALHPLPLHMQQQELSIEAILSILNIEALNEMQEAALKATEEQQCHHPVTDRLGQYTGFLTSLFYNNWK